MTRFSIGRLLGIVSALCFMCATLFWPSPGWAGAATGLTIAILLIAVVSCVYREAHARAFWLGMAIFGWSYFVLIWGPFNMVSIHLPTTAALRHVYPHIHESEPSVAIPSYTDLVRPRLEVAGSPKPIPATPGLNNYFAQTGQSIWTIIIGCLGGILTSYLYDSGSQKKEQR